MFQAAVDDDSFLDDANDNSTTHINNTASRYRLLRLKDGWTPPKLFFIAAISWMWWASLIIVFVAGAIMFFFVGDSTTTKLKHSLSREPRAVKSPA